MKLFAMTHLYHFGKKKQKIDQNIDKELNNSIDIIIITTGHSVFKKIN